MSQDLHIPRREVERVKVDRSNPDMSRRHHVHAEEPRFIMPQERVFVQTKANTKARFNYNPIVLKCIGAALAGALITALILKLIHL